MLSLQSLAVLLLTTSASVLAQSGNSSTAPVVVPANSAALFPSSAAASAPASSSAVAAKSATPVVGPTYAATATNLLPVPVYGSNPTATGAPAAYSTATASGLAVNLPAYTYNLTSETLATRVSVCNQTTQFCATSRCTLPLANVTVNFCNPTTMGWNCQCDGGAVSRLQPVIVPVNSYDCKLRTSACLTACQNPAAIPPIKSVANCSAACTYVIGDTCGTANQVIPLYQVSAVADIPKYYGDTSKGGAASTPASSALGSIVPLMSLWAAMMLGVVVVLA